jgi:hypothetical protein
MRWLHFAAVRRELTFLADKLQDPVASTVRRNRICVCRRPADGMAY